MNCPLCSAPLLFGATTCPCGYNAASSPGEELPIELSYWESLRAYWRVYWPTQVVAILFVFLLALVSVRITSVLWGLLLQFALGAALLFLFMPRICSRPYRGFSLVVVETATAGTFANLRGRRRLRAWQFLWWRQILAALFAWLLARPLNIMLNTMGLQLDEWIAIFAGVLVIGPILMKMLIGHQFEDFRIEARRERESAAAENPAATTG